MPLDSVNRHRAASVVIVLAVLAGLIAALSQTAIGTASGDPPTKAWVCKYVGTPGVDERLQTGQNPISVSLNAIPIGPPVNVGDEFADAQGRSLVIAFDTSPGGGQQGEPPPECPTPPPPTTTTAPPPPPPQTTTTTIPATTTTSASTTSTTSTTTSTTSTSTTAPPTTAPPEGIFVSAVGTTCQGDVPVILIEFGDQTALNGHPGTLTFIDLNGQVIEVRPITYQAGQVIVELYPGASVDPVTGEPTDWPGWVLQPNGLWVEDPTDALWRAGLTLVVEVNPTATTSITYPPASAACASPENPPPGLVPPVTGPGIPTAL